MIGRVDSVDHFDLVRWARTQVSEKRLKQVEAHVLLVLATYANKECIAWPSIKTLALCCGLKPTPDGRNSAVSAALQRLQDLGLLWTTQGGHAKPARRELLYRRTESPQHVQRSARPSVEQPSAEPEAQPSVGVDPKSQAKNQEQEQLRRARGSHPASRTASHPSPRRVTTRGNSDLRRLDAAALVEQLRPDRPEL